MSVSFMHEVLNIADRFVDCKDPDTLDRQGHLTQVLIVVVIFHLIMGISFIKMEEYEHKHPHFIVDPEVSFEFTPLPALPRSALDEIPNPISPVQDFADPGNEDQAKSKPENKISIPTNKALEVQVKPRPEPARTSYSHILTSTPPPPVAVTANNPLKPELTQADPNSPEIVPGSNDLAGSSSTSPASGASYLAGGIEDGVAIGNGKGIDGSGGPGHHAGDEGTGSNKGNPGDKISTTLPQTKRAMFNITPYCKQIRLQLASNWHLKLKTDLMVLFVIGRDGKVLSAEISKSSGRKRLDAQAVAAIESIDFDPIPEGYRGDSLTFQVDLSSLKPVSD